MPYPEDFTQVVPHYYRPSWENDHRTMTGGTLTLNKTVEALGNEEHYIRQYVITLPIEVDFNNIDQHKAVHTFEHYTAYSGGLRDELEEITDEKLSRKAILDISPYIHNGHLALRVLSIADIGMELLKDAMTNTLVMIKKELLSSTEVPFADSERCGQFRFHNPEHALLLVEAALQNFEVEELEAKKTRPFFWVGDLRLLKPELDELEEGQPKQVFFNPEVSYDLTKIFEANFPEYWKLLGFGIPPLLFAATYGCETGAYIGFDFESLADDIEEHARKIHVVITAIMMDLIKYADGGTLMTQTQWALTLIQEFSQAVYEEAKEKSHLLPRRVTLNRS